MNMDLIDLKPLEDTILKLSELYPQTSFEIQINNFNRKISPVSFKIYASDKYVKPCWHHHCTCWQTKKGFLEEINLMLSNQAKIKEEKEKLIQETIDSKEHQIKLLKEEVESLTSLFE